ncbi:MAG TPA: hypothetical protein VMT94_00575 [Burkholderiales bacterium]|nr:hypothetical protein [Burkholderiales bacterium]
MAESLHRDDVPDSFTTFAMFPLVEFTVSPSFAVSATHVLSLVALLPPVGIGNQKKNQAFALEEAKARRNASVAVVRGFIRVLQAGFAVELRMILAIARYAMSIATPRYGDAQRLNSPACAAFRAGPVE